VYTILTASIRTPPPGGECASAPGGAVRGTLRLDAIGSSVTGSVDVTFPDGSFLSGPFDVPVCGLAADACDVLDGSGTAYVSAVPFASCTPAQLTCAP
jgi:hypothetical protein